MLVQIIGLYLHDLGLANGFLVMKPKHQPQKKKIYWISPKLKLLFMKNITQKIKRQHTKWEKMYVKSYTWEESSMHNI